MLGKPAHVDVESREIGRRREEDQGDQGRPVEDRPERRDSLLVDQTERAHDLDWLSMRTVGSRPGRHGMLIFTGVFLPVFTSRTLRVNELPAVLRASSSRSGAKMTLSLRPTMASPGSIPAFSAGLPGTTWTTLTTGSRSAVPASATMPRARAEAAPPPERGSELGSGSGPGCLGRRGGHGVEVNLDGDLPARAGIEDLQGQDRTALLHGGIELLDTVRRDIVGRDDHVAGFDARLGGRASLLDLGDADGRGAEPEANLLGLHAQQARRHRGGGRLGLALGRPPPRSVR